MSCSQDGHPGVLRHRKFDDLVTSATQGRWVSMEAQIDDKIGEETVIKYCEKCKLAFLVK